MPAKTRQHNVLAAQWTANGGTLEPGALTAPDSSLFGIDVFNTAVQAERLPKTVFARLQKTLDDGEPLDVVTDGDFIHPREPIEICQVRGNRVVVRRAT